MTGATWTTGDYALIVSLCSAAVSLLSLGWNIWSKFIFPKPKMEVRIAYTFALGVSADWPSAISLTAINHGPLEITLKGAIGLIGPTFPFGKTKRGLLKAYRNWPHSFGESEFGETPGLPVRLPVGEQFSVHFSEAILKVQSLQNLGFTDGFGREHFADRKSRRNLKGAMRAKP